MDRVYFVNVLREITNEWYPKPQLGMKDEILCQATIRWTIIRLISNYARSCDENYPALEILNDVRQVMLDGRNQAKVADDKYVYITALEVINDLTDVIVSMQK